MNALIINSQAISTHNGLYSLNDLHKVSGNEKRHEPNRFLRNDETQALIHEIESENQIAYDTVIGKGKKQGTYACRELVYRYAMWISPKFSLMVIRAFDALNTGVIPCLPPKTTPSDRTPLIQACTRLSAGYMNISDVYKMVGNHFGYDDVQSIPSDKLPQAVAFVYELILARPKNQTAHNLLTEHHCHNRKAMKAVDGIKNHLLHFIDELHLIQSRLELQDRLVEEVQFRIS